MDPRLFLQDLERKPQVLQNLAELLRAHNPWSDTCVSAGSQILFLGMGSSHYASSVAAGRLRARGVNAIAELASSDLLPLLTQSTVVVAVSASGSSIETLRAVEKISGKFPTISLTNTVDSRISRVCDTTVFMNAEPEEGGVACRSFTHTLGLQLALEEHLLPNSAGSAEIIASSATALASLWDSQKEWLPESKRLLTGGTVSNFAAPAQRLSSAAQSALMLREGPRIPAVGCETGDWSHVDVYLTKTQDYRLMLFTGSKWESQLLKWCEERGVKVIGVGAEIAGVDLSIRYQGDKLRDVPLLVESYIAELIAANLWLATE